MNRGEMLIIPALKRQYHVTFFNMLLLPGKVIGL